MTKRKPQMITHYEITVFNQLNGDIERYLRDATQEELDELIEWFAEEPWCEVVIDHQWEEPDDDT